jgi:glycosyltransferase involved in cell wall biosynthesis
MAGVSVNIIARNEEASIGPCLESVQWADEIIVCDDESVDHTVDICRRYPKVQVFVHPLMGEGPKRNFALSKATCEWILVVDADERISPELRDEILQRIGKDPVTGYYVRMRYFAFGRWIEDYMAMNPRLFQRKAGRFPEELVHTAALINGPMAQLEHPFIHVSRTYATLGGYLARQNIYTSHTAMDLYGLGRRMALSTLPWHLVLKPLAIALRKYLLWGFRFGMSGLLLSALSGYDYFLSYAKLWELQMDRRKDGGDQECI